MTCRPAAVLLAIASLAALSAGCQTSSPDTEASVRRDAKAESSAGQSAAASTATLAHFVDRAPPAGIVFTPRNGEEAGHRAMIESLGTGIALFDYDGDGRLDVFAPGGGCFGPNQTICGLRPALFRNDGGWRFTEVTEPARLAASPLYSHAAVVGDYDSDGFPDLLLTGWDGLLLYHNNGDGTFTEVSRQAGLICKSWNTSAAWGDMNGDGHLDLYVACYADWSFKKHPFCGNSADKRDLCPPHDFDPLPHHFFLGNGDGTFREVSSEVGLVLGGKGLGVLSADIDGDGLLDYYVTDDATPNRLYRNQGGGKFEEIGLVSGVALNDAGMADGNMGVDLGDYNLDGRPDLFIGTYEGQNFALYRNDGDCAFQHVSGATGVSRVCGSYVGWGTVFLDFDRDGDEDAFVTTGHVEYFPVNCPSRQLPLLFENRGGTRFVNVASEAGPYCRSPHSGRGVAVGDLDDDGRIDMAIAHRNEPISLLENQSRDTGHWLSIRLIGTTCHRDAVGARVLVKAGQRPQWRWLKGGGYLSTSDRRLFFGLGTADRVERIEVHWLGGGTDVIQDVAADQRVTILQGTGAALIDTR